MSVMVVVYLVLGLVLLVAGADLLVRGASRLALRFGISPLLIFIVAFMGIPITGFLTDTVFGDPKRIGHALIVLALSFGALATGVVLRFRSHYVAAAQAREAELP